MLEGAQRRRGAGPLGDDDLLERDGGAVAGAVDAGDARRALLVDDDLAARRQLDRALQPLGVGQQADLDEDAVDRQGVQLAGPAVLVLQPGHLRTVAVDLGGPRGGDDVGVGQAVQLAQQDIVGLQLIEELDHGHVFGDTGQVDGGLDPGVAAADHGDRLALEQRAVTVRAERDALVAVVGLTGDAQRTPPGAGRQDDGAGLQAPAAVELDGVQLAVEARDQPGGPDTGDLVDVVRAHVLAVRGAELGALGVDLRDVVLDGHRVEHLAADAVARHAGADALAGGVDRRRGTGRAAADDEHLVRGARVELVGGAGRGVVVEALDELLHVGPPGAPLLPVQVDGRAGEDAPLLDLVLEERPLDGDVLDPRVQDGHRVQRLDDRRAVLAGQRHVRDELVVTVEVLDRRDRLGVLLDRHATDLQQRQDQRAELVAHRDAGEPDGDVRPRPGDGEGGATLVVVGADVGDQIRQAGDLVEQLGQLTRLRTVVQGADELDGLGDLRQVLLLQLGLEGGVEHGILRVSGRRAARW
ncbi:hypothetical protein SDC9_63816 [bioreactor metagenome]|uniref:Uncharacterized protein n=1 Tax=bioreactor metagenome TaxID=1076179 RepID=A0A644XN59_9ZZZZ